MLTLYQHQKMMLSLLRAHDAFAIFAEQGTGKTLPVLMRISELLESGKAQDALVVCPKAVMGSWVRDIEKLDPDGKTLLRDRVTVINYDRVWRKSTNLKLSWDVIVLDESHMIKSHTARRTKCVLTLAMYSKYRYILTGTPISNGQLENIFSQFAFLHPKQGYRDNVYCTLFGSYYDWLCRYALLNKYHQPYRYQHVDELQTIIHNNSFRVKKCDCLDLPDKLPDEVWEIELTPAVKKLYKKLMEGAIEEMDVLAKNPLAKMTKLRQMCSGQIEGEPVDCEKITALRDFLDAHGERKLAIFCSFRNSIDAVVAVLEDKKLGHVVLDGRRPDKTIWKRFQTDPAIQVIVCQYQSANAGIDLFAADTILFYEPTLSSNVLEQTKDRIHRIGQHQPCSYIHFLTKGTIEKEIYRALRGYSDFGEKLFTEYITAYQKGFQK